jgi:hypothetical protein
MYWRVCIIPPYVSTLLPLTLIVFSIRGISHRNLHGSEICRGINYPPSFVAFNPFHAHFRRVLSNTWSRNSVVGIATVYGLDDRRVGVRVPVGSRIFSSPRRPDRLWDPSNPYPMGTVGSFPGLKRPGRQADHSPPASVKVKKMCIYTSTHGAVLN